MNRTVSLLLTLGAVMFVGAVSLFSYRVAAVVAALIVIGVAVAQIEVKR